MKSHCCIIDSIVDPDEECVFDDNNNFKIEDCEIALQLVNSDKNKNDCKYWVERCPNCGFVFTN